MSKVKTSDHWTINEASTDTNQSGMTEGLVGACEMDSHADSCCLGMNFTPIYFTRKICDVSPFLSDLPSQQGVQICSGATAYDDSDGGTYILVLNKALWFGDRMQHSLINPNQVRAYGVSLCDDPMDPNRQLGMMVQDTFIPFTMAGTTCSFATRTPTSWELDNCPHLEITSNSEWNPCAPHFVQDPGEHTEDLFEAGILAYDTRHRRPDVAPEELARQWGIGLDTAAKTLKAMTQAGIWHAVHPLNHQY